MGKAPRPDGIPKRTLKHLPMLAVLLLVLLFTSILLIHHFSPVWIHARVISILKPGKDPAQLSSYQPISLLDVIGKLFEKILLNTLQHQVGECGLLRDETFGFRPGLSTTLQLPRLVERITKDFGEWSLTGALFLDVAKAFHSVWIEGLLYKFTNLKFPSYIVHVISSTFANGRSRRPSGRTRHPVASRGLRWRRVG